MTPILLLSRMSSLGLIPEYSFARKDGCLSFTENTEEGERRGLFERPRGDMGETRLEIAIVALLAGL